MHMYKHKIIYIHILLNILAAVKASAFTTVSDHHCLLNFVFNDRFLCLLSSTVKI